MTVVAIKVNIKKKTRTSGYSICLIRSLNSVNPLLFRSESMVHASTSSMAPPPGRGGQLVKVQKEAWSRGAWPASRSRARPGANNSGARVP